MKKLSVNENNFEFKLVEINSNSYKLINKMDKRVNKTGKL